MLILTRKESQTIVVGDQIVITVCQIQGGRVRVGIDAPESVPIRRGELDQGAALPATELPDADPSMLAIRELLPR